MRQRYQFCWCEERIVCCNQQMNHDQIQTFLQSNGGDWLWWQHNPPSTSHFGGVWERQIRTARSILQSILNRNGTCLDDESFRTLLTEVEGTINSRPLTAETLSDVDSPLPLSPINLLTLKSQVVSPPPGIFQRTDLYCRKRWRRIKHLSNVFWGR